MIDTLQTAKRFELAGIDKPQAEAIVAALADLANVTREDLVTKSDLRMGLAELKSEIKADLAQLRTELKTDMANLGTGIANIRGQLLWALFGSQAIVIGAFVAPVRFTEIIK